MNVYVISTEDNLPSEFTSETVAAIAQLNKVEEYLFEQIDEPASEDDPEE